jgi:hypothetical protein
MRMEHKGIVSKALLAHLAVELLPATVEVTDVMTIDWESATFSGARHIFSLAIMGEGANRAVDRLEAAISEMDIPVQGHLVADILVTARRTDWKVSPPMIRVEVQALTVKEAYRAAPKARRREAISPAGMGLPGVFSDWRKARAFSRRPISPEIESNSVGLANLAGGAS